MGFKLKKGSRGNVVKYISRSQAVRKLQISLAQFRRLCILKGVYPVEPHHKVKKGSTALKTWYYRKDIQFLLHEPILQGLRDEKTHDKKVGKLVGKKEWVLATKLIDEKPTYSLVHVIRERYPTFVDALRDLDDCLALVFLFSTLPVDDKIDSPHVLACLKLVNQFQQYVIRAHCLDYCFLSIKGIYYQATIHGQTITWITPYQFSQTVPHDVDFKVMSTFLELYETLLAFINFKLYAELNLVYPPRIDTAKDAAGGGMNALILEQLDQEQLQVQVANDSNVPKLANDLSAHALRSLEKKIDSIDSSKDAAQVTSSKVDLETPQPVVAPTSIQETVVHVNFADEIAPGKQLFSNCVFWLSREVPRYSLEFVIKAFGGQVGWDASAGACSPFLESDPRITHQIVDRPQAAASENTRELLQPQWVYDCCNASILLKTDGYHPGETLPPHLSPFVKHGQEDYNPAEQVAPDAPVEEQIDNVEPAILAPGAAQSNGDHQDAAPAKKIAFAAKEELDAKELAKGMMSRRSKKLYDKIQFGKKRKEEVANKLRQKKKQLTKNQ